MLSLRFRRALAIVALTTASVILPLSDLSAAPRAESRWHGPERRVRVVHQSFFWTVLKGIFEKAGMRMDDNG